MTRRGRHSQAHEARSVGSMASESLSGICARSAGRGAMPNCARHRVLSSSVDALWLAVAAAASGGFVLARDAWATGALRQTPRQIAAWEGLPGRWMHAAGLVGMLRNWVWRLCHNGCWDGYGRALRAVRILKLLHK